jgi:hypothetical protein
MHFEMDEAERASITDEIRCRLSGVVPWFSSQGLARLANVFAFYSLITLERRLSALSAGTSETGNVD